MKTKCYSGYHIQSKFSFEGKSPVKSLFDVSGHSGSSESLKASLLTKGIVQSYLSNVFAYWVSVPVFPSRGSEFVISLPHRSLINQVRAIPCGHKMGIWLTFRASLTRAFGWVRPQGTKKTKNRKEKLLWKAQEHQETSGHLILFLAGAHTSEFPSATDRAPRPHSHGVLAVGGSPQQDNIPVEMEKVLGTVND